ncbi:MAG: hypothetical protein JJU45_20305 [Acidimicrobiia bacterium]|nr:hypothetical protein [Acidimicrobiia bacterium]
MPVDPTTRRNWPWLAAEQPERIRRQTDPAFDAVLDDPDHGLRPIVRHGAARLAWPPDDATEADWHSLLASYDDLVNPFASVNRAFARTTNRWGVQNTTDGAEVAAHIRHCLDNGQPASFLRVGDGEGDVLALGLGRFAHLTRFCAYARSLKHLGEGELLLEHRRTLLERVHEALANAEGIGIPERLSLMASFTWAGVAASRRPLRVRFTPTTDAVSAAHGIAAVFEYFGRHPQSLRLADTAAYSARFHENLLGHYEGLVRGRHVVVVANQPALEHALVEHLGATGVTYHHVPKQAFTSKSAGSTGHFPDRYGELLDTLASTRPGALHLVGAGLLGKIYCDAIREAGGIAVDIGSAVDVWMGRATRPHHPQLIRRYRLR